MSPRRMFTLPPSQAAAALCIAAVTASVSAAITGDPPSAAIRKEVESVLSQMNEAVLTGDKAAYLSHVKRSDSFFSTEQQHWADDLDKHKPVAFTLSIEDPQPDAPNDPLTNVESPSFTDHRCEFQLRMTYRTTVGHASTAKGKSASWPVVFVKEDPDGPGPQPEQWLYAGEKWLSLIGHYRGDAAAHANDPAELMDHSADIIPVGQDVPIHDGMFVVHFLPGAERTAREVLEAFPVSKRHDDEGFGVTINRPLVIKLYTSMEHLKATVYLSMPDNILGGWNEPGESIKFMYNYTRTVPRWTASLAHEYGHTATWELGPKIKDAPWWVHEGTAELAAEEFMHDRDRINSEMRHRATLAGRDGLARWEDISDYDKADQPLKPLAYFQGHHLIGWISDKWGRSGRNDWLRAMGNGRSLDQATRDVFKMPFTELDKQWRASLLDPAPETEAGAPRK